MLSGALAVFIQFYSIRMALDNMNFYEVRRCLTDIMWSCIIFALTATGGVGGFNIALLSTLAITIYLKFFAKKVENNKVEPWLWLKLKTALNQ